MKIIPGQTIRDETVWKTINSLMRVYNKAGENKKWISTRKRKHTIFTLIKPARVLTLLTVPLRKAQLKCRLPQSTVFWCALQVIIRVCRQALLRCYSPCSKGNISIEQNSQEKRKNLLNFANWQDHRQNRKECEKGKWVNLNSNSS